MPLVIRALNRWLVPKKETLKWTTAKGTRLLIGLYFIEIAALWLFSNDSPTPPFFNKPTNTIES
jgi:hypothetical protein